MPPHLRFDRQDNEGWIIAEGAQRLGEVHPTHMTFVGFHDTASAGVAAEVASRVLRQWRTSRHGTGTPEIVVSRTADGLGFTFKLPDGLWHALLLELAQRIHAATRTLRQPEHHPEPETAA